MEDEYLCPRSPRQITLDVYDSAQSFLPDFDEQLSDKDRKDLQQRISETSNRVLSDPNLKEEIKEYRLKRGTLTEAHLRKVNTI